MNKFIVRTSNVFALEQFATIKITYKAKFLDILLIETTLSKKRIRKITGVYSVEDNEIFGTLCGA